MGVARSLKTIENSPRDVVADGEHSYNVRSLCTSSVDVFEFLSFCGCVINCDHVISDILASEKSWFISSAGCCALEMGCISLRCVYL